MLVKKFRGKIFYPVLYEGDGAAALEAASVTTSKNKQVPVFGAGSVPCEEMRKGMRFLLGKEDVPGRIARVYEVRRSEVFRYPKAGQTARFYSRDGRCAPVALTSLRFILFETHVAFIEMGVELEGLALEEVMNATYYLCEIKDKANHFEYERTLYDPETKQKSSEPVAFSLREWFLQCAGYLPGCASLEDRSLASCISKPLLYGYYLLDGKGEHFERLACNIAHNYKASYKGLEADRDHLFQVFENSYWCVSYNGAVNVSYQVGDPVTDQFFEKTFVHKWESEYLFLFLNTIHQKYASLKYLAELDALSCAQYDYALMRSLLQKGEIMREKCALLKTRSFFNLPSNVEHVNRVYSFFQWCFDVPGYLASLNAGIEESVNVYNSYVTRIKQIEDLEKAARSTRNEIYIALITASITCLTFFKSSYATLVSLVSGRFAEIGLDGVIITATFLTTLTTVAFNLAKQRDSIQETRQKLKKLKNKVITL